MNSMHKLSDTRVRPDALERQALAFVAALAFNA